MGAYSVRKLLLNFELEEIVLILPIAQKILSYRWESIKKEEASKTFDQIWEPSEKVKDLFL